MADPTDSGIYEIVNLTNGKRYIGSALKFSARWAGHRHRLRAGEHHSRHLQAAWNRYGEDAFDFRVVETCDRDALLAREQHHIDAGCDYNKCMTAGSPLGVKHSEPARRKMSERRRGVRKAKTHVDRVTAALKARWDSDADLRARRGEAIKASYTDELRAVRSEQSRARWADPQYRARMTEALAKASTQDAREKFGALSKERWADPEYRADMVNKMRAHKTSEEARRKISATLTGRPMSVEYKKKKSSLADETAEEILRARISGQSYADLAAAFSISETLVQRICRRQRYQWVAPEIPPLINISRSWPRSAAGS
jgi:group I intron endonuclease